jgi:hypothetical protein
MAAEPIVVGGASYPSPVRFQCLWQFGDSVSGLGRGGDKWAGYELAEEYSEVLVDVFNRTGAGEGGLG